MTDPAPAPATEFLNTCEEVHAGFYGIYDGIFPAKAGSPYPQDVMEEPHYYLFGQMIGKVIYTGIVAGIVYLILT
jgi:hypothetical protein